MVFNRRRFLVAAASAALPAASSLGREPNEPPKRHVVSISFDDGFKKSFLRTAELYEQHGFYGCFNVIASAHLPSFKSPDKWIGGSPLGDFTLWNELKSRGHEVMPHGYKHTNLKHIPHQKAVDLIQRCLDFFSQNLLGFQAKKCVFNFPYNGCTPELEQWLRGRVQALRRSGPPINPLPHEDSFCLTCKGYNPDHCEQALDSQIEQLLSRDSGWLIFNAHGLDGEGWGPMRSDYLGRLLGRLKTNDSVDVMPVHQAFVKYAGNPAS